MKIWVLTMHELRRIRVAPLAWFLSLSAYFFLGVLFLMDIEILLTQSPSEEISLTPTEAVYGTVFHNLAYFCVLATPLLSMRLFGEERRSDTLSLLFSAPLTMRAIVLGKFFSLLVYFMLLTSVALFIPTTLFVHGQPDWGVVASGALGLMLLLSIYCSIAIYASVVTTQPTLAGMLSLVLLLSFWLSEWFSFLAPPQSAVIFSYLSFGEHFFPFLSGEISTRHVIYDVMACGFFLFLSIRHLERARLRA